MERLYETCAQLPASLPRVRELLEQRRYSPRSLAAVMIRFIDEDCFCETQEFIRLSGRAPEKHELHSDFLPDLIALFLAHGMDANLILREKTLLSELCHVDFDHTAADAARLLMIAGADPNLDLDGESAFDSLDFDVIFGVVNQEDRRLYDAWVHLWLVMIGFGGKPRNGAPALQLKDGCTPERFREHERFDFSIEKAPHDPDGFILHIIDKETGAEAARL